MADVVYAPPMRLNCQFILAIGACFILTAYAVVAALKGWPAVGSVHHDLAGAFIERFCLYVLFGAGLSFFLPGRLLLVCALLVVTSFATELSQVLRPDLYPTFFDAAQKIVGGIIGAAIAQTVLMLLPRA